MSEDKGRKNVDAELDDGEEDEDSQKDKYMTFQIGNEDFGIEIAHVIEIIGIQKITEVPEMPDFVKGVINLRGQVIPVIDVRTRFKIEARAYDDRTCVIVVRINELLVGLIVDTVKEVVSIPQNQVSPPPKISSGEGGTNGRFVQGMGKVGDSVKILLDSNRLLFEDELKKLEAAGG